MKGDPEEENMEAEDATSVLADDLTPTDTTVASKTTHKESSSDSIVPLISHQMMPPLEEKY